VFLPEGKDWYMRPVIRGLCRYESLLDGSLDLHDIAEMNDALDVMDTNSHLAHEAARSKA
jgi:hypothetical protein